MLLGAANAVAADRAPIVAAQGDAFVAHQNGSDLWSIGSENLELVLGFDASRTLTVQRLFNPVTGRALDITPAPAFGLTAGGERITLDVERRGHLRQRRSPRPPTTASPSRSPSSTAPSGC